MTITNPIQPITARKTSFRRYGSANQSFLSSRAADGYDLGQNARLENVNATRSELTNIHHATALFFENAPKELLKLPESPLNKSGRCSRGDPTDVLVLMDEAAFPGCVLKCQLIGVIEGEQGDGKEKERNDRVIAVELEKHSWADVKHVDAGEEISERTAAVLRNLHQLYGKERERSRNKGR